MCAKKKKTHKNKQTEKLVRLLISFFILIYSLVHAFSCVQVGLEISTQLHHNVMKFFQMEQKRSGRPEPRSLRSIRQRRSGLIGTARARQVHLFIFSRVFLQIGAGLLQRNVLKLKDTARCVMTWWMKLHRDSERIRWNFYNSARLMKFVWKVVAEMLIKRQDNTQKVHYYFFLQRRERKIRFSGFPRHDERARALFWTVHACVILQTGKI